MGGIRVTTELWAEIELRRFGDPLTWLGMKNRSWAVKQWAETMLQAPLSSEMESFLLIDKRRQLEGVM